MTMTHRYGTKSTQKEYGPKIDAKTATQLTLEEVIEERNALPVSISERRKTPTVSMKDHMSLDARWSLLPQLPPTMPLGF